MPIACLIISDIYYLEIYWGMRKDKSIRKRYTWTAYCKRCANIIMELQSKIVTGVRISAKVLNRTPVLLRRFSNV